MKATVLLFNIPDKGIRNQLRNLFTALKITTKYIEKPSYNQTLGQLAGIVPAKLLPEPYNGPELEDSMIIFANIPDKTLDIILMQLRSVPSFKFPYKAVLTETNCDWTVTATFAEIKREHDIMHASK